MDCWRIIFVKRKLCLNWVIAKKVVNLGVVGYVGQDITLLHFNSKGDSSESWKPSKASSSINVVAVSFVEDQAILSAVLSDVIQDQIIYWRNPNQIFQFPESMIVYQI